MTDFSVVHAGRETTEPFSPYVFDVLCDDIKVAQLGHDFRGDEYWMRVPGGNWITLERRVLEGGGPQPLTLSSDGVLAIRRLLAHQN